LPLLCLCRSLFRCYPRTASACARSKTLNNPRPPGTLLQPGHRQISANPGPRRCKADIHPVLRITNHRECR
jgi:hypothetical protein